MSKSVIGVALVVALATLAPAAEPSSLVRVERQSPGDLVQLREGGVPVITRIRYTFVFEVDDDF